MHEILHVVLKHVLRQGNRDPEMFNIATDIVVNSNILRSNNMDPDSITLRKYGESMHLAPDGKEGYEYTAEDVYGMMYPDLLCSARYRYLYQPEVHQVLPVNVRTFLWNL